MQRQLVIVGRYHETLFQRLKEQHAADGTAVVLLDRRRARRRSRVQMRERDQRRSDRRQSSSSQALLQTAGFFAVHAQPALVEA